VRDFTRRDLYYASVKFIQQANVKEITKKHPVMPRVNSSYSKGEMRLPGIQGLFGMATT
jgi:hypothetical protein